MQVGRVSLPLLASPKLSLTNNPRCVDLIGRAKTSQRPALEDFRTTIINHNHPSATLVVIPTAKHGGCSSLPTVVPIGPNSTSAQSQQFTGHHGPQPWSVRSNYQTYRSPYGPKYAYTLQCLLHGNGVLRNFRPTATKPLHTSTASASAKQ